MKRPSDDELVELINELIRQNIEERKKQRLKELKESGAFIQDVHEVDSGIGRSSFKVVSETITDDGDLEIVFEAIQYLDTEFTIDEPYSFKKKGKLIIRISGEKELIWLN